MEKMKHPLMERLKKKGWTEKELEHAKSIFFSDDARISGSAVHFNRLLYWMIFTVMVVGNIIISIAFIPLYLTVSQWAVLIVLGIVGFCFGYVFNVMIKDLDYIDPKHHTVGLILLPVIAIVDIFLVLLFVNQYVPATEGILFQQNPLYLGSVYIIAFLLPYLMRISYEHAFTAHHS